MKKLAQWLYQEFIAGRTLFDYAFLLLGLAIQILVFCLVPDEPIMIVSGIAGIFSVILCSQGKISTFVFGFVQVVTYLVISYRQQLYGEVAINVFYFLSMIYGVWCWRRRYRMDDTANSASLKTRSLSIVHWIILTLVVVACSVLTGWGLSVWSNDSDPFFDAFTTVPAIPAQLLMVLGYREQWFFWFCIDVGCTIMWLRAGNWSIMMLYAFWCVNCIYGWLRWTQSQQ